MTIKKYTLSKEERLSWKRYIDLLFEKGQSFVAFPLRVIFLPVEEELPAPAMMMVSVSKKKFKRAPKRNRIKRQVRETYRLQKPGLYETLRQKNKKLLIAFLYLDNKFYTFDEMRKAMAKAIHTLQNKEL